MKWGEFEVDPPSWRVLCNDWWPAWQHASGLAVICGRPYRLVVVDFDDAHSWDWALANLPAVRGVRTRRGGHLHFSHPPRGIVGNRSGRTAIVLEADVRADVKGLGGLATGPYSRHPSGHVYEPIGDWRRQVRELPVLPELIARQALDKPPRRSPLPLHSAGDRDDPIRAFDAYLSKVGGIPEMGCGSDDAVFRAAAWAKANAPALTEAQFVGAIRRARPEFGEAWIASKWRSAKGR